MFRVVKLLTLALVRVCTAVSTRAKFPLPSVLPVSTYRPMHLTCLELELLLEWVLPAVEDGRGGVFSLAPLLWVILMTTELSGSISRSWNAGSNYIRLFVVPGGEIKIVRRQTLRVRRRNGIVAFWWWFGVLKMLLEVVHSFKPWLSPERVCVRSIVTESHLEEVKTRKHRINAIADRDRHVGCFPLDYGSLTQKRYQRLYTDSSIN